MVCLNPNHASSLKPILALSDFISLEATQTDDGRWPDKILPCSGRMNILSNQALTRCGPEGPSWLNRWLDTFLQRPPATDVRNGVQTVSFESVRALLEESEPKTLTLLSFFLRRPHLCLHPNLYHYQVLFRSFNVQTPLSFVWRWHPASLCHTPTAPFSGLSQQQASHDLDASTLPRWRVVVGSLVF